MGRAGSGQASGAYLVAGHCGVGQVGDVGGHGGAHAALHAILLIGVVQPRPLCLLLALGLTLALLLVLLNPLRGAALRRSRGSWRVRKRKAEMLSISDEGRRSLSRANTQALIPRQGRPGRRPRQTCPPCRPPVTRTTHQEECRIRRDGKKSPIEGF